MGRTQKSKNLTLIDCNNIEFMLNDGQRPSTIATNIGRDPTTIRKEIKSFSFYIGKDVKCSNCENRQNCHQHYMCYPVPDNKSCSSCKYCKDAAHRCPLFKVTINCAKLDKKHVCNGCPDLRKCKITYRYIGNYAYDKHRSLQNSSHHSLKLNDLPIEFQDYLSKKICDGISPEVILGVLPEKFKQYKISVPTLYDYIDKGFLSCNNLDLKNKVSRRTYGSNTIKRNTVRGHQLNGRSIENLEEDDKKYPFGVIEIDTVEGIKGGAVLFTMLIPKCSLMIAYKLKSKTQEEVKRVLDMLEEQLGNYFYTIFRTVIPDNGAEFVNFNFLETSIYGNQPRCHVYYTHTYASYEKPHVENNHILLRWLIKKGVDITLISEETIQEIIVKLNNYPRKAKGFKTPIELLEQEMGNSILDILGLYKIPIEDLVMRVTIK